MRIKFLILLVLVKNVSIGQQFDSSKYSFNIDTRIGQPLPDISLLDTAGNKVKLSSFKGKTLYIDFWSTTCTPCIKMFPYEDTLSERLRDHDLDKDILIVKICAGSPIDDWKSIIRKQKSNAINLILPGKDYKIWRRYKIPYYPTYQLVDSDLKYLGSNVCRPNDPNIDYYLFRATQKINFLQAVKELQQFQAGIDIPTWFVDWNNKRNQLLN